MPELITGQHAQLYHTRFETTRAGILSTATREQNVLSQLIVASLTMFSNEPFAAHIIANNYVHSRKRRFLQQLFD